ncbi:MAG: hypothetical protein ACP5VR_01130 [Acidimicrobiales bacterium]
MGWVVLLRSLARTVEEIGRAHEATGEALQAARRATWGWRMPYLHPTLWLSLCRARYCTMRRATSLAKRDRSCSARPPGLVLPSLSGSRGALLDEAAPIGSPVR